MLRKLHRLLNSETLLLPLAAQHVRLCDCCAHGSSARGQLALNLSICLAELLILPHCSVQLSAQRDHLGFGCLAFLLFALDVPWERSVALCGLAQLVQLHPQLLSLLFSKTSRAFCCLGSGLGVSHLPTKPNLGTDLVGLGGERSTQAGCLHSKLGQFCAEGLVLLNQRPLILLRLGGQLLCFALPVGFPFAQRCSVLLACCADCRCNGSNRLLALAPAHLSARVHVGSTQALDRLSGAALLAERRAKAAVKTLARGLGAIPLVSQCDGPLHQL